MTEPPSKKISYRRLPDGSYNNKPSDPEYFNNYYHTRGAELISCHRCGMACRKNYLSQHLKTKKCINEFEKFAELLKLNIPELDF